ncbi:MAG: Stk1 family PASTA domain-containing Ser/Thr kinase [Lachnospiraceae bacterium]|nr:Stk1 family PASTA domain-containing Ser/Thr kinase [Lachnospiraceae bacterium]
MIDSGTIIAERYEVEEKIGAGGMSDVYRAKDLTLGRSVAVKVLKSEYSEDMNFVTKFRAEAQSAAGLEHPNIVNVYDVGSQDGFYYIIMEYVSGITLKTYIEKKGRLNYKETLSIAIQVARGIQAAHAKHIIHRDIKPQNIMISTEGKVKVTDFGIARAVSENTIHSDVMGSVHYASPEQARNGYVSNRSDIYSLGIVMYEMVTGRVPFDGDSTVAVAIKHLQDEMVSPAEYADDLPISLEKIILKCTQKSADRRYDSMENLLVDLRKSLLSPNEDFVTMVPYNQEKTRVLSDDEVKEIQESNTVSPDEEDDEDEKDGKYAYIYEDDEDDDDDDDEDDGGFLNPKMEKIVNVLRIVIIIIIALIVLYFILDFTGVVNFGSRNSSSQEEEETVETVDQVEMIDLRGMTMDEAEDAMDELGLSVSQEDEEETDEYEPGQIISQDVEEGEMIDAGTTVYVVVAVEPEAETVTVLNVVGYTSDAAMTTLQDKGFEVVREFQYDSTVEAGKVISQSPKSGSTATEGDTVTLYISQGSETTKVPNVMDQSQTDAAAALGDAGLNVGSVTEEYSDTVSEGLVISQSVSSGSYVEMGTSVDLVISMGAEEVTYYASIRITAPSNVTTNYANIYLYKAESDELIQSWTNQTSFPFTATVTGITGTDQGTIVIEWYYTDADGAEQTYTQEDTVTFHEE